MARTHAHNISTADRAERKAARTASMRRRARRTATRQAWIAAALAERI